MPKTDSLVDVTLCRDFIGADRESGQRNGILRNPDRPNQLLQEAAADTLLSQPVRPRIAPWRSCPLACLPRAVDLR